MPTVIFSIAKIARYIVYYQFPNTLSTRTANETPLQETFNFV